MFTVKEILETPYSFAVTVILEVPSFAHSKIYLRNTIFFIVRVILKALCLSQCKRNIRKRIVHCLDDLKEQSFAHYKEELRSSFPLLNVMQWKPSFVPCKRDLWNAIYCSVNKILEEITYAGSKRNRLLRTAKEIIGKLSFFTFRQLLGMPSFTHLREILNVPYMFSL